MYISLSSTFDPNTAFGGTWQRFGAGRCLWGVGPTDGRLGGNVSPSLPNITGDLDSYSVGSYEPPQGAFKGYTAGDSVVENCAGAAYHYKTAAEGGEGCFVDGKKVHCKGTHVKVNASDDPSSYALYDGIDARATFDASRSNSTYNNTSGDVVPSSIGVIFWQRVS